MKSSPPPNSDESESWPGGEVLAESREALLPVILGSAIPSDPVDDDLVDDDPVDVVNPNGDEPHAALDIKRAILGSAIPFDPVDDNPIDDDPIDDDPIDDDLVDDDPVDDDPVVNPDADELDAALDLGNIGIFKGTDAVPPLVGDFKRPSVSFRERTASTTRWNSFSSCCSMTSFALAIDFSSSTNHCSRSLFRSSTPLPSLVRVALRSLSSCFNSVSFTPSLSTLLSKRGFACRVSYIHEAKLANSSKEVGPVHTYTQYCLVNTRHRSTIRAHQ